MLPYPRISGEIMNVYSIAKYLGHFCTDDLSDDNDIEQLENLKLYAQGNTLARKLHICTSVFCSNLLYFSVHLW